MSFYCTTLYWPRQDEGCEWRWKPFLICALPQVDILRDMYQVWITLTDEEQERTKFILNNLITNRGNLVLERPFRIVKAVIGTYEEWSKWQDERGACGFSPDLTIITDYFETDISISLCALERFIRKGSCVSSINRSSSRFNQRRASLIPVPIGSSSLKRRAEKALDWEEAPVIVPVAASDLADDCINSVHTLEKQMSRISMNEAGDGDDTLIFPTSPTEMALKEFTHLLTKSEFTRRACEADRSSSLSPEVGSEVDEVEAILVDAIGSCGSEVDEDNVESESEHSLSLSSIEGESSNDEDEVDKENMAPNKPVGFQGGDRNEI